MFDPFLLLSSVFLLFLGSWYAGFLQGFEREYPLDYLPLLDILHPDSMAQNVSNLSPASYLQMLNLEAQISSISATTLSITELLKRHH